MRSPAPTEASSRLLAGFLACIAGFVNSAGFVLIGAFTSHVTGNVGRFANDVAAADVSAAIAALAMIFAFFAGAFLANLLVESALFTHRESAVAVVLVGEATMLGLFVAAAHLRFFSVQPRGMDLNAAVLCAAMGMQNSLITRLSGATVRTTHLTGVVTDLGIETAHWVRWRGARWRALRRSSATFVENDRPDGQKLKLLLTIASAFTAGAVVGAAASLHLHRNVMAVPALGLVACAVYALHIARKRSVL
jgi:uncharacterized membrane protein YoaK (UPF0700 family)